MVTLDDYGAVAIMIVPAAMQPAIMFIELRTRSAIVTVAIVIPVAADADAKALSARKSATQPKSQARGLSGAIELPASQMSSSIGYFFVAIALMTLMAVLGSVPAASR